MKLHKQTAAALTLFILLSPAVFSVRRPVFDDKDCLACHGKKNLTQAMPDGSVRSIYVNPGEWEEDVHKTAGKACVDCHTWADPVLHFRERNINVDCASCHPEEEEEYTKNIHLTFPAPVTPGKELPLCYHCHTKHHVLRLDNPDSSVHRDNIGAACSSCHAETMVDNILKGSNLWKISGHRKGDLKNPFDMNLCLSCHYEDSAHGNKSAHEDFCSRCHAVRASVNPVVGPTHVNSARWKLFMYLEKGLLLFLFLGAVLFAGIKSSGKIKRKMVSWLTNPHEKKESEKPKNDNTECDKSEPEKPDEHSS